ncbi:cell envelope biogenesis protein TolA [Yersinia rohdei]|uniref:cell envelope biogenesis protein TolA n=1 Tax=Yersinia rohdei TaxID=29485 RepID=UPI00119CAC16|nr:cell envelope biogenesis protein TolA [Yersinia rohdei]
MSDEKKELALVTLPAEKVDLEVALLNDKFIDELIDNVRKTAGSVVGDLKTTKGRGVYITMADHVRKSKTAFEVRAKELVAELKARPALIDANRKKFRDEMDKIAVEIRKPVTEYEAEQERLKQEAEAKKKAEQLAAEIEVAHEMALLMNDAFDRAQADKKAEDERLQKERDDRIAAEAAAKVKRDADLAAQQEREASARREAELKLQAEQAERDRIALALKAEQDKKDAAAKAEREKQEAIAAEQRKAQETAERIQREAQQKEDARLAEEKRVADEADRRAKDVEHRRTINRQAVADLIANGLPEDCAQKCVAAIAKNLISSVRITY